MAGAGKKTFTAGETLTASDVNTYLMEQSVMYFAGTAARSSAIPTPSTGMTTYRSDVAQLESYNGSAWIGMSGLQLVKTQTIGSGVSSVTVTNAFSATYENYLIKISGGVATTTADFQIQIGNATSAYNYSSLYNSFNAGTPLGLFAASTTEVRYCGGISATNLQMDCNIDTPFLARPTIVTARHVVATATGLTMQTYGYLANNNSYTDLTIKVSTGNITGGTIYVYGYAKG